MKVVFEVEETYAVDMEQELFNKISDLLDPNSKNYNRDKAGEEIESFCYNIMTLHPEKCIEWFIKEIRYTTKYKNMDNVATLYEADD